MSDAKIRNRTLALVSIYFQVLIVVSAIGAAALLIISQLGQWSDKADVINHALPQLLAVAGVFSALQLVHAIRKRKHFARAVVTVCLVIGVAGRMVLPELTAPHPIPPFKSDKTYRIAVFNTKHNNPTPSEVVTWLSQNTFDFLVLLEAGPAISNGLANQYPFSVNCLGNHKYCSTKILSPHQPIETKGLAKGDPQNRKSLSAAKATFCLSGKPLTIIGAHLSRPWPESDQNRDIRELLAHLSAEHTQNLIVAGDFNLTPWSFKMKSLDQSVDLKRTTRALFTWPANKSSIPLLPLDHIFIGRGLRAAAPKTGAALGSDHLPVIMTFSLQQEMAGDSLARCGDLI